VKIKAVVFGNIVDVGGSMLSSILLGIGGMVLKKISAQDSIWFSLSDHLIPSGGGPKLILFSVGALFSIIGGFVAARMAKEKELIYGGLSTILCLILGLYSIIKSNEIGIKSLGLMALTVLLGLLGGYFQANMKNRRGADNDAHNAAV
jgi:hypothetical protein